MLNKFFTVLIIEISKFLQENSKFFELNEKQRNELLKDYKLPNSIKEYLENVESMQFASDLLNLTKYVKGDTLQIQNNQLANSIANFLCQNFANDIYSLPLDFFKINYKEQQKAVNTFIASNSNLANTLKDILTDYSYQEILNNIQNFAHQTINTHLIIVQTPIEISSEQKKEIRDKLNQEYNLTCLPIFQINRTLIGGMRMFVNGKVQDFSWLGKINLITSLKI